MTKHYAPALLAALTMSLASAGTIGISAGALIVGAEPGDGSLSISASTTATDLLISGINFDLVTPGCSAGAQGFLCPLGGFNSLFILGGNGDDAITLTGISATSFTTTVLGGPGADVLIGSGHHDHIFGDTGDDVLIGGTGGDCLQGGPGNNVLIGGVCNAGTEPVITALPRAGVPEPGGLLLVATGLGVLPMMIKRRRKR